MDAGFWQSRQLRRGYDAAALTRLFCWSVDKRPIGGPPNAEAALRIDPTMWRGVPVTVSVSQIDTAYTADMATVRDAERDAEKLLESWWQSSAKDRPLPVDPTALARRLGIRVQVASLDPDESGNIYFPPEGAAVITLNRGDAASRQRFTCAHEIGHYVRRQANPSLQWKFVDYRGTLAGLGTDTEEIYANQFAAALLMPAHLVARWHRNGQSVESLARRFATSAQAMELRLRNLRLT